MLSILQLNLGTLESDIWVVLALIYIVWAYSWAKKALGSARLAITFAIIVVFLTFFLHPELVWIPVIVFIIANFLSPMLEKMDAFKH